MENFAHSHLFVKGLLAPLLAPEGGLVVLQDECENTRSPHWLPNLHILQMTDDGWISSMVSAGARQPCWLSSLCRMLVKLRGASTPSLACEGDLGLPGGGGLSVTLVMNARLQWGQLSFLVFRE